MVDTNTSNHTLFVYGTLKRGGKWHHLIQNSQLLEPEDAVTGEMYIYENTYPVLFRGNDLIRGEVYVVNQEVYDKIFELESDADYAIETLVTEKGITVEAYIYQDESVKNQENRITDFEAADFFDKWLRETPRESESFQFYLEWGGRLDRQDSFEKNERK